MDTSQTIESCTQCGERFYSGDRRYPSDTDEPGVEFCTPYCKKAYTVAQINTPLQRTLRAIGACINAREWIGTRTLAQVVADPNLRVDWWEWIVDELFRTMPD